MRHTPRQEAKTEARALGVLALVCYSATFAAMLAFGYSVLALAVEAAGLDIAVLLSSAGV
jgi:hypothetical protein